MSPAANPGSKLRSVGAIFAGFVAVVVLSIGTDALLHATGIAPAAGHPWSNGLFGLATVYRSLYGVVGSYVTARLAPTRPMWHALVGGAIGLALAIFGALVTWNKGSELGPHWYPLALIVTAMPCAWLGGRINELMAKDRA